VLSSDPDVTVVGEASRGEEALEKIPLCKPDLVTLDFDLPGMDGITTLRELHQKSPRLPVIMMSAFTREGADITLEALSAGAVDFIDKNLLNMMDFRQLSTELLEKIKVWGNGNKLPPERNNNGNGNRTVVTELAVDWNRYDVCIIGASTGGPAAIERILKSARADFPTPVVVVQHMPFGFTRPFAERLDGISALSIQEATDGATLVPGRVLIARSGQHLKIGKDMAVRLSRQPADSTHRPSINVTMYSAACSIPCKRVAGILLTGMGDDGAEGMFTIRDKGGLTVAEHEDTCIVPGMPRMACQRGGVDHSLPLPGIASLFA
jgi:two-component system chemotaxis response regulator CheB